MSDSLPKNIVGKDLSSEQRVVEYLLHPGDQ